MSPVIAPVAQCLGGAAHDLFESLCLGTQRAYGCFYFALCEQVGWAGEDILDPLNQKLDPLGVPLPDVLPGDISLHRLNQPSRSSLVALMKSASFRLQLKTFPRLHWSKLIGSPSPPSRASLGVSFLCGFCSFPRFSFSENVVWAANPPHPGRRLSGCPLSLQLSEKVNKQLVGYPYDYNLCVTAWPLWTFSLIFLNISIYTQPALAYIKTRGH